MAKTEHEIVSAHKRTLEALTGKKCEIKLISKEEAIISKLPLQIIETIIEKYNASGFSIQSKRKPEDVVLLRKLFFFFAAVGYNHRQIANHLHVHIDTVRHHLRDAKKQLQVNDNFIKLHNQIKTDLTKGN